MKLKDLFEIESTDTRHSTARDFGSHKAAVAAEKAEEHRKTGHHHGYTGKKPASRDPEYTKAYKMGKETRAAHGSDRTRRTQRKVKEGYSEMLSPEQAQSIRDVHTGRGIDWADGTEEVLYSIFLDMGEMPYGVAKARTGDPSEWIGNQIDRMSSGELERFLNAHTA